MGQVVSAETECERSLLHTDVLAPPASSHLPSFTFLYLRLQLYGSQRSLFTQRSNLSFLSKHQITHGLTSPRTVAFPREQKGRSAGWTDRLDKGRALISTTSHRAQVQLQSPPSPPSPSPPVLTISSLSVPQDKQAGVCFHLSIVFLFAVSVTAGYVKRKVIAPLVSINAYIAAILISYQNILHALCHPLRS